MRELTGQAAGAAAAVAVAEGNLPREVNPVQIRAALRGQGAHIREPDAAETPPL
jgi:hypothetical protein